MSSERLDDPGAGGTAGHRSRTVVAAGVRARTVGCRAGTRRDAGDLRANDLLLSRLAPTAGDLVLSRIHRRQAQAHGVAGGSSTRSTGPASTGRRVIRTGPCMWRCGRRAG